MPKICVMLIPLTYDNQAKLEQGPTRSEVAETLGRSPAAAGGADDGYTHAPIGKASGQA